MPRAAAKVLRSARAIRQSRPRRSAGRCPEEIQRRTVLGQTRKVSETSFTVRKAVSAGKGRSAIARLPVSGFATGCKLGSGSLSGEEAGQRKQRLGSGGRGQNLPGSRRRTRHRSVPSSGTARGNDHGGLALERTPDSRPLTSIEIRIIAIECSMDANRPKCSLRPSHQGWRVNSAANLSVDKLLFKKGNLLPF